MQAGGYRGAVILSCGNAGRTLSVLTRGLFPVLHLGPEGDLNPNRWLTPAEMALHWPQYFDATSGHLPVWLMLEIGRDMRLALATTPKDGETYDVPTGSGETVLCMRWAYPSATFQAVYNCGPGTKYDGRAPLNALVANTGPVKHL